MTSEKNLTKITSVINVINRYTMKYTTKQANGAPSTLKNRMIGLRLNAEEMKLVEKRAKLEQRPLAQMARILLRMGIECMESLESDTKRQR